MTQNCLTCGQPATPKHDCLTRENTEIIAVRARLTQFDLTTTRGLELHKALSKYLVLLGDSRDE